MKVYGKGILWDGENDRPLIRFKDGFAEVDSNETAERLICAGVEVEGYEPKSADDNIIDYSSMKRADLFSLCKEHGITAGATSKSEDLIKLLQNQE